MNTRSLIPKLALALGLFVAVQVVPAHATTIKEFYALPDRKQPDFITDTVNSLCDKLRSEYDNKGQRKPSDLLQKQKDFARFIIALFDERDSTGAPVAYLKLESLIYSTSLEDASLPVERVIQVFVTDRYKEKLAADAAKSAQSQDKSEKP